MRNRQAMQPAVADVAHVPLTSTSLRRSAARRFFLVMSDSSMRGSTAATGALKDTPGMAIWLRPSSSLPSEPSSSVMRVPSS